MMPRPSCRTFRSALAWLCLGAVAGLAGAQANEAPAAPAAPATPAIADPALRRLLGGAEPASPADLQILQDHVQALLQQTLPATVSLGGATGVIVEGNLVLTAGHVTRTAGRRMTITLHDGRRLRGVSLGADLRADTGLIRITGEPDAKLPFLPMGRSADLRPGEWCVMLGHPSGSKPGRSAPARLGRVLRVPARGFVTTDCTMQGGDSGGPLLDMHGRVVGINSRISANLADNMHVPIDAFRDGWAGLLAGEVKGEAPAGRGGRGRIGLGAPVRFAEGRAIVGEVPDGPAHRAGLRADDVLRKVDGSEVGTAADLARALQGFRPADEITVEVLRGEQVLVLAVPAQREGR